jgi:hypothetical protein
LTEQVTADMGSRFLSTSGAWMWLSSVHATESPMREGRIVSARIHCELTPGNFFRKQKIKQPLDGAVFNTSAAMIVFLKDVAAHGNMDLNSERPYVLGVYPIDFRLLFVRFRLF